MISLNSSSNKYILFIFLISAFLFVGCAGQGVLKKDEKGISSEEKDYYPSDNVLKHVISASIYESQGEFLLALTQYNQALLYDSTDTEIYMAIAEMYQRVGEYESALRVLGRGYKNADEKNDIIRIKGELEFQLQDYDSAADSFEKLLELNPEDDEAWSNLAYIYERQGKPLKAIYCYDRLLALIPDEKESIFGRQGSLYTAAANYEEAINIYRKLYSLRPDAHILPFLIGGLHLDIGDTTAAADYFEEACGLEPKEISYWDLAIRLEIIRGNEEAALAKTDTALFYNQESSNVNSLAGSVFMNYDLLDRAEVALIKSVELDTANVDNLVNLGFLYHEKKQWENAEKIYSKAMRIAPDDIQLKNNFAYMLAEAGKDLEKALEMVSDAISVEPENSSYLDTKGWILYKLNRNEEAVYFLEKAQKLDPENYEILMHLGDLYDSMGNTEKARQAWQLAVEKGADAETLKGKLDR